MEQKDLTKLTKILNRVEKLQIVRIYQSKKSLFAYNFLIGLARGLGTAVGATLFLALLIYILTRLQWLPLFGDNISRFLEYLEYNQPIPTK